MAEADELPAELDVTGFVGPYTFPDVARRRIPATLLFLTGVGLIALYAARHDGGVLVTRGLLWAGVAFFLLGLYHRMAAYPLNVKEIDALVAATKEVGFPVGHASAQVGFRGLRSRPNWRILLYSADDPPTKRGLVLVDAVTGAVLDHYVEDNPEDWSSYPTN
ncbi:MAG: hypothetical protein H0W70_10630 [Actinobacteria bacterium]|nr:hypothetical protein [Actinomycetota bacterium]